MESVYAKLEKRGSQILTEGEEGDLADESLLLDDGDDSDDSVSSIIGDKYRWSHNDSLDDGDNDVLRLLLPMMKKGKMLPRSSY